MVFTLLHPPHDLQVPGQLVCHIPNNDILTTKVGLLSCFREKFCKRSFNPTTPTKIKQGVLASTSSKTPSRSTEEFLTVEEETPKHQVGTICKLLLIFTSILIFFINT